MKVSQKSRSALIGIVVLSVASVAQANISSRTVQALGNHPDGGRGLELAITEILTDYSGQPYIIVREILTAAAGATEEQIVSIGMALAAHAKVIARNDVAGSRAIEAVVLEARNEVLQKTFTSASDQSIPGLVVPSGSDGGGLDSPSPS